MRRGIVLVGLLMVGVLSIAASQATQAPQRNITVDKLTDNLFVLKGGGGNTAAFITSGGVVVVDTKNPGWGQPILDTIRTLTDKPVTMLINTHTHGDHVGGNPEFRPTVDIVVQENTRANMERMEAFKTSESRGMAKRTFKDRLTIGRGADQIDLYYFGPGHTNGDAWIVFPALRTAHAGDIFARKSIPLIDPNNGGSVLRYPETLSKAHAGLVGVDTIINGHNDTTTTLADLEMFSEFMRDYVAWAQTELKAGKTPEQAAAEFKVPEKYPGFSGTASTLFGGMAGQLKLLAEEMKK
ncbi:MAG TPA: MBL fold metallo-hydrolase [Vicinamibacterales bacterium]|nr:MBL fold metallo-hydrolase [Vicinamibacterales bacterium]